MSLKISPSILSGDFSNMKLEVERVKEAGADLVHCDVMDGVFVNNLTFGAKMVADLRKCTDLPLEVHLMIVKPEKYLQNYISAGADYLSFHIEATEQVAENIAFIKNAGIFAGLAISPDTEISKLAPYLDKIDYVIIMGVYPGFSGQGFIPKTIDRVAELKKLIVSGGYDVKIIMDGGLSVANGKQLIDAGMDIGVSGSAFFGAQDKAQYVKDMKSL